MNILDRLKDFGDRNSNLVANEENGFNKKREEYKNSTEEQCMEVLYDDDKMFDDGDVSIDKKTGLNIRNIKSISNLIFFFRGRLNEVLSEEDIENGVFYSNTYGKSSKLTIEKKAKYNMGNNKKLGKYTKINKIKESKSKTKKTILENLKRYGLLSGFFEEKDVKEYYRQFIEGENPEISQDEIREALHIYYSKEAKYSYEKMISSHAEQKKFGERFTNINKEYRVSLTLLHIPEGESISYGLDNKVFNHIKLMHLKKLLKIDGLSLKEFKDQYPPISIDHRIQRLAEL